MKHDFRYFFREGIRNMFSHGFMSFAAIGVTVACLVIMGTFSLVAYNANENLKDLQKENAVLAFVDENLSDNEAKALQSTLEKIPGAADCTFVSRQEARDSYVEQYDEDDLYSDLDPSIFRHRYVIHLTDAAQMQQVVSDLEATKLTTFDRRDEIAIMKMVGATDGFIRWPFVYEGLLIGLMGAVIAFGLQWLLYEAISKGISGSDTLQLLRVVSFRKIWGPVAGVFGLVGILVGVGGSLTAIRKFLRV